jgi:hypothetical protein
MFSHYNNNEIPAIFLHQKKNKLIPSLQKSDEPFVFQGDIPSLIQVPNDYPQSAYARLRFVQSRPPGTTVSGRYFNFILIVIYTAYQ